ncbi:hypothetical protein ACLMJK_002949 [Lecanora helva]
MPKQEELNGFGHHLTTSQPSNPTTHHSSSLPTTPNLRARKLSFDRRSPSPEKQRPNGSPKSAHSDSQDVVRSRGKAPSIAGCKYETGMAFSRRRIPYSIGGDQLERPKAMPKKYLNPSEEEKLSGDMRELYDRILPSRESDQRRARFVKKLEKILNQQWTGSDIKVHVFGSSGNMLCTSDSDVDICITTPVRELERVCLLANALAEHGMERVVCVPHAKVPIVKFWDPELRLACDMNVNNTLALENTRMIKTYVEIDERVRPLAMIIKRWTKRRILNDAALGGTLSSYTWICLILNFLQTRNPPILPSLHKKPHLRRPSANGKSPSFDDNIDRLRGFGHENRETLGELLFHFFRRYAYDLDYEKNVISVREAKLISKEGKKWHLMQNNRLCVEEPFNTERNLGNTADDTSFRGIHLELRRAFDQVKDAKLDECLEQYVFPATEEKFYEKPVPKPPPVLTRSRSQSQSSRGNRGGYSNRGTGRHNMNGQRSSGRRSSSAAAFNKVTLPQVSLQGLQGRDHFSREQYLQAQYEQLQLHHELFNKFQFLQAQEHELRLLQAQTQIHAQIHAQGSTNGSSLPQTQPTIRDHNRMSMSGHVPLTDPLRNGQYFHPFQYPQVPGTPQQSVHTQPSSPSLKVVQPDLRRSVHRSSVTDTSSANNRSHSQPARPLPPSILGQNAPPVPVDSQALLQYQHHLRQQQIYGRSDMPQGRPRHREIPLYQDTRRMPMDHQYEDSVPKEYVGYWVNDSPPQRGYREDQGMQRLPTYHDLHPRVRGIPPNLSRLRDSSRSPSPSPAMPFRERSFSIRSASSAPPQPMLTRLDRVQPSMLAPRNPSGPMPNGTDGWIIPDYSTVPEASSRATTVSEATSSSDERQYETPITTEAERPLERVPDDTFNLADPKTTFRTQQASERSRVPLESRNGNFDSTPRQPVASTDEVPLSPTTTYQRERSVATSGGLGIQFGEHEVRRHPTNHEERVSPKSARTGASNPPSEIKSEQKPPVPVPLLSPVREVRTPSPVAKRKEDAYPQPQHPDRRKNGKLDLYIPPFAELVRAKQEKQKNASLKKPNGVPISHSNESAKSNQLPHISSTDQPSHTTTGNRMLDESPRGTAHHPQASAWQQQSGKKGKKNKSRPSSGNFPVEQMPVNEAERKGG